MTPLGAIAVVAAVVAAGTAALGFRTTAASTPPTPAEIRLDALTSVAKKLYAREAGGTVAQDAAARIARDPQVDAALRARDPHALRAAALRELFAPGHVVRISIHEGGVATDVGGTFVVAPQERRFTVAGRTATVQASIQDIAGFVKLIKRETGLDAVVTDHHGHRYSSLGSTHLRLPVSGVTDVHGRARLVGSFTERGWHGQLLLVRVLSAPS